MSPRITRRFVKSIAAASLLSAAALTAYAIPAQAAGQVLLEGSLGYQSIGCYVGHHGVQTYLLDNIYYVSNSCINRVWFHEYADGSGWSYCISPHAGVYIPGQYQWPKDVFISGNTAAC